MIKIQSENEVLYQKLLPRQSKYKHDIFIEKPEYTILDEEQSSVFESSLYSKNTGEIKGLELKLPVVELYEILEIKHVKDTRFIAAFFSDPEYGNILLRELENDYLPQQYHINFDNAFSIYGGDSLYQIIKVNIQPLKHIYQEKIILSYPVGYMIWQFVSAYADAFVRFDGLIGGIHRFGEIALAPLYMIDENTAFLDLQS